MARRIWILALAAAILCAGCKAKASAGWPVVSQITVTCERDGALTRQTYTSQAKMRQILNHLRNLGQKFSPFVDPDTLSARIFRIHVAFTDGSSRLYQTKSDRYVRFDNEPWQQADPERIEKLNHLLQSLPGDPSQ